MRKRRRSAPGPESSDAATDAGTGLSEPTAQGPGSEVAGPRAAGPWDVSERPVAEDDEGRAFLGALSVPAHEGVELRLQVDEAASHVGAVMLVAADGAMELRPFAAPRHEDIWDDIRPRIAAEATRMGGTATEVDGPYGPALQLMVPGTAPDGTRGAQPSTVLGISGPRWLLRVSTFGRPAVDYRPDGSLETVLRDVVVMRGTSPMAPGDPLPLTLPSGARRLDLP